MYDESIQPYIDDKVMYVFVICFLFGKDLPTNTKPHALVNLWKALLVINKLSSEELHRSSYMQRKMQ